MKIPKRIAGAQNTLGGHMRPACLIPLVHISFSQTFFLKDFLSFALIISSDGWQSKAQFNTLCSGENNSGYRAENIDFFHR